jgi:hypothetical protein
MDRELRSGYEWPWRLSRNLATCRVFVPLYSRRYFQSVHCGKEWSAFRSRARNGAAQGSSHAETIIPVLWSPVRPDQFPLAAKSIHFEPRDFGETYAEFGFYGIMKVKRFRDDYDWTVLNLARRIVDAAERTEVPPGPTIDYDAMPNAFEEGAPLDVPGDKWLRIILGFRPEVSDLHEQADDLCSARVAAQDGTARRGAPAVQPDERSVRELVQPGPARGDCLPPQPRLRPVRLRRHGRGVRDGERGTAPLRGRAGHRAPVCARGAK